jgi:peptide/nickel transport system permease protein
MTELLVREPVAAPDTDEAPPRRESRVRYFLRRPGLVVSLLYVALVVLAAFAPQVLAPGDPAPCTTRV